MIPKVSSKNFLVSSSWLPIKPGRISVDNFSSHGMTSTGTPFSAFFLSSSPILMKPSFPKKNQKHKVPVVRILLSPQ